MGCFKSKREQDKLDKFDHAIFQAKLARDQIKQYIKRMEENVKKQKSLAKENLKQGKKERAKLCLARSKAYETQIESGQGQLNLLEQQIIQIDQTKIEQQAIKVLQDGNSLLKKMQSEISIEKWEQVSDDLSEMRDQHNEISEFLQGYGVNKDDYDNQIEDELNNLMRLQEQDKPLELPDTGPKKEISNEDALEVQDSKKESLLA